MRIGANDVAVNKGWTVTGAAVGCGGLKRTQAGYGIGTVDLSEVEVGEVGNEMGDIAARGVDFDRNADGVAVVFNAKNDGQLLVGGGVERFPKLALRG